MRTAESIKVSLGEVLVPLWGLPLTGLESLCERRAYADIVPSLSRHPRGGSGRHWRWEQGKRGSVVGTRQTCKPTLTFVPRSFAASCFWGFTCVSVVPYPRVRDTYISCYSIVVFAVRGWNGMGRITRETNNNTPQSQWCIVYSRSRVTTSLQPDPFLFFLPCFPFLWRICLCLRLASFSFSFFFNRWRR